VKEGKIIAIGGAESVPIPDGAERHDVTGKIIMPGLIDTHSHIGGPAGGDGSAPIQPDARVIDARGLVLNNGDSSQLHSDTYDFNDAAIPTGVSYWAKLVEMALPAR